MSPTELAWFLKGIWFRQRPNKLEFPPKSIFRNLFSYFVVKTQTKKTTKGGNNYDDRSAGSKRGNNTGKSLKALPEAMTNQSDKNPNGDIVTFAERFEQIRQLVNLALDELDHCSTDYKSLGNGPVEAAFLNLWSARLEEDFLRSSIAKRDEEAKYVFTSYGRSALISALDFIQAMHVWKDRIIYLYQR